MYGVDCTHIETGFIEYRMEEINCDDKACIIKYGCEQSGALGDFWIDSP